MITWFREVTCSNCTNYAILHVSILLTLLPNGDTYTVGVFDLCGKLGCATALESEAKDAINYSGTEQHVWFNEDEVVRNLHWFISQI
jgi:hypothetical protein